MLYQKLLKVLVVCIIFFLPLASFAQVDPPPGGELGDPDAVPIDGGLSLLLAAGVGYGIKKVHERKKKHNQQLPENQEK